MIRGLLLFLLFYCVLFNAKGWNGFFPSGARSAGMAYCQVALSDPYSASNNQACLSSVKLFSASTSFESRFISSGLSAKNVNVIAPVKKGAFSLSVNSNGIKSYNENKIGFAYGRSFGPLLQVGMQLNYFLTSIADGYGNYGGIGAEIGCMAHVTSNLTIGAHVFNPTRSKIGPSEKNRIPTVIALGALYKFSDKLLVTAEATQNSNSQPLSVKAGLEYLAGKFIYLRTGVSVNPALNSLGIGFVFNNLRSDISASYHAQLGITSGISLIYQFKEKVKELSPEQSGL